MLSGNCGVGKTHLIVSLAKELIEKHHVKCVFLDFRSYLDRLRSGFNNAKIAAQSEQEKERIRDAELLLIDELGAARQTDFTAEIVSTLINERYNLNKPFITTTNYAPSPCNVLGERGVAMGETLGDRLGNRTFSRVMDRCKIITIEGHDYRQSRRL